MSVMVALMEAGALLSAGSALPLMTEKLCRRKPQEAGDRPWLSQSDRRILRKNAEAIVVDCNEDMTMEILMRDPRFRDNCFSCHCTACGWFPTTDSNFQSWYKERWKAERQAKEHRCSETNAFRREKW